MERFGEGGMDIGLSSSHCGDVGEPCSIDELSCNPFGISLEMEKSFRLIE